MKDLMIRRQAIYAILSALYRGDLDKVLEISNEAPVFKDFLIEKGYSRDIVEEIKNNRQVFIEDYERLFFGPTRILAPPWESVYENEDRLLFGQSELQVRRFYRSFGLDVIEREAADHLAFEVAFMSRLCSIIDYENLEDVKKNIKGQIDFLTKHLLSWTTKWNKDVAKNSKTKFWRDISEIIVMWFHGDLVELNNVLKCL
ncbi:TorD/DmsD family molecular chaperone [Clostridium arbusti]|uniref:TorD/DmsD family molecular chaperone n=1 Tax=Clostridium arbusti TaxID=1137848 RepID=UPI00028A1860|nr:molecular chaperone TorD family protein [Clostridium arbusti]